MTATNGKAQEDVASRLDRVKPGSRLTPETEAWLERRTLAFQQATSGRGRPVTYGAGAKDRKAKS